MKFKHTKEVLERYAALLAQEYRDKVPTATRKLFDSVKHEVIYGDNHFEICLWLKDYWYYVEHGRKSGKYPPIDKIEEWIRAKPIIPREKNGYLPTEKELAFLIARKIGREGTEGKHILRNANMKIWDEMKMSLKMALIEDLKTEIHEVIVTLNDK